MENNLTPPFIKTPPRLLGREEYTVGEELIRELETKDRYSRNAIAVKTRNKDLVGHVPESLAAILFPLVKQWKIYEINVEITGKSRRAPEGTWVLGGGIELPCKYTILGPKIHRKYTREKMKNAQV